MIKRTSLLSALLVAGFGVASAQQPGQPGAQPDRQPGQAQPGQQQPGQQQPGQQQPGQQQPGQQEPGQQERDQDIAAAGQAQSGDFLTSMEQNMLRTDELERSDLLDSQGEDIGNIAGILIDHQNGEVKGLLVNLGGVAGVGARTVALSWDAVEISRQQEDGVFSDQWEVRTQMSQQELEDAPEFEEEDDQVAFDQ